MAALVDDWSQKARFGDFLELERNVRSYVVKNMVDLKHYELGRVKEWEEDEILQHSVTLEDHIRFHLFPYERVINGAVQHAISGRVVLSSIKMKEVGGDKYKLAMAELHERVLMLSRAGKLLDAMTSINQSHNDNEEGEAHSDNATGWTDHHTSCSGCHRSLTSGWFILNRRLKESNRAMLLDRGASAADVLDATTKLDTHPEVEVYDWTKKWIDFVGGNKGLQRGILDSDKPLVMGVVKVLTMSESSNSQEHSKELNEKIGPLFQKDGEEEMMDE